MNPPSASKMKTVRAGVLCAGVRSRRHSGALAPPAPTPCPLPAPRGSQVHGGGFVCGTAADAVGLSIAAGLAKRGVPCAWASVDYRLAPRHAAPHRAGIAVLARPQLLCACRQRAEYHP